jgi:hypothetical protein
MDCHCLFLEFSLADAGGKERLREQQQLLILRGRLWAINDLFKLHLKLVTRRDNVLE